MMRTKARRLWVSRLGQIRMESTGIRRHESERGNAFVELAVALPMLVLVLVGAVDFARVFYVAMELTAAARAGAQYGAKTAANTTKTAVMQSTAIAAAADIAGVSATAGRLCQCATDTGTFSATSPVNDCSDPCTGKHLVTTVTVNASATFNTISRLPGIPPTLSITRTATQRAPD
jgi:Flp pilus assembly protein TadG